MDEFFIWTILERGAKKYNVFLRKYQIMLKKIKSQTTTITLKQTFTFNCKFYHQIE